MHITNRPRLLSVPLLLLLALAACDGSPTAVPPPPAGVPDPRSISLSIPNQTVVARSASQVTATVIEANGEISTRPLRWSSSDTSVAIVNGPGTVIGIREGSAVITASLGSVSANLEITVMRAPNPGGPQSTFLRYASTPGDWIGQGFTARYGLADGTWRASLSDDRERIEIQFDGGSATWWSLNLAAPEGDSLAVGSYENAARWPFQEAQQPGLDFSGSGRGCSKLTGRFVIHDLAIDHAGELHRLHVSFRQHCESGASYLDGELAILLHPLR